MKKRNYNKRKVNNLLNFKGLLKNNVDTRTSINGDEYYFSSLKVKGSNEDIPIFFWEKDFDSSTKLKIKSLVKNQEIVVRGIFRKKEFFTVKQVTILIKEVYTESIFSKEKDPIYVIIDLETTGFSNEDEIIEIAYIKWKNGKVIKKVCRLVCPSRQITSPTNFFNNISSEELRKSDPIEKILPSVREDLKGCIIVGHNAISFDYRFLNRVWWIFFQEVLPNLIFDTYSQFKRLFPKHECYEISQKKEIIKQYNNESHRGCFGLENIMRQITKNPFYQEEHRALPDALDNLKIFEKIMKEISKKPGELEKVYKSLEKSRKKRMKKIIKNNSIQTIMTEVMFLTKPLENPRGRKIEVQNSVKDLWNSKKNY